jgi:hypothetical protein
MTMDGMRGAGSGTHDAGVGVDCPRQCVNGDNVWRLFVPWSVLPPVRCRHFFPRVVKLGALLEDLHCGVSRVSCATCRGDKERLSRGGGVFPVDMGTGIDKAVTVDDGWSSVLL